MAFDLAELLKAESSLDEQEEIEYIALELIDPDPLNFYSLDGIDQLAGSIELIGLQQPIRVRTGENGHVTVVSGHRRRAAVALIAEGGSEQFAAGVPCIREHSSDSAAMRELKLIYANSSTRVLSASELSRQAERVTELLYQLKEEGTEFPGRMRDHVAEACNVSKTKLARLHAIRSNLDKGFLQQFDDGILSEAAAYELQKRPADVQAALADEKWLAKRRAIHCDSVNKINSLVKHTNAPTCRYGEPCQLPDIDRIKRTAYSYSWESCNGGCCLSCYYKDSCSYRCQICREEQKDQKAKNKETARETKKREAAIQQQNRRDVQDECKRFLPLIEAAGLGDNDCIDRGYGYDRKSVNALKRWAAGDFGDATFYGHVIVPDSAYHVTNLAKYLNCSADFICGLTDDPTPVSKSDTVLAWHTGKPERTGWYAGKFDCGGAILRDVVYYDGQHDAFRFSPTGETFDAICVGWIPLPED